MAPLPPSEQKDNLPSASDPLSDLAGWTHTLPDADREENEETLARMVNILDYAEGFTLLFARCNFPALRRQLEDAAEEALAFRNVRVIRINLTGPVANIRHLLRDELLAATKSTETDLYDNSQQVTDSTHAVPALHESKGTYVAETSAANPKLILFLSGLELSIPYDDPNTPALAQLNLGRDFFPRELPHPLLIWLPDYAVTAVSRYAPDFWSWRSGLFEFSGTSAGRTEALRHHVHNEQGWSRVSNLSGDEKLARRRLLESLLDDYSHQSPSARQRRELADLYFSLGEICHAQADAAASLHYYREALTLLQAVGDRGREASTLNNIGGVYSDLGETTQALDFFNQALPLLRAIGDRRGEANTLNNIGGVYSDLGEKAQALDFYKQALPLLRAVGDRRGEATTLNNIGLVYSNLGEKAQALDFFNQALPLLRAVGDRGGEATTLNNIGLVYDDLRETAQALDFYNQALPLRRAVGDRRGEAITLNNIGGVYHALGETAQALDFYNQALPLRRAVGDRWGESITLYNMAMVYVTLGCLSEAVTELEHVVELEEALGHPDLTSDRAKLAEVRARLAESQSRAGA